MNFKPGDYVTNHYLYHKEYTYYLKVIEKVIGDDYDDTMFKGLVIETNALITPFKVYTFIINAYSLIEDKSIINRLDKILVFK